MNLEIGKGGLICPEPMPQTEAGNDQLHLSALLEPGLGEWHNWLHAMIYRGGQGEGDFPGFSDDSSPNLHLR